MSAVDDVNAFWFNRSWKSILFKLQVIKFSNVELFHSELSFNIKFIDLQALFMSYPDSKHTRSYDIS